MHAAVNSRRLFCIRHLAAWKAFAEQDWHDLPNAPGLGLYGTGYNDWGVQTNQKYLAAMAVLSAQPSGACGHIREQARDRALAALRFSLRSHVANGGTCTDGTPWGHTWISGLGIERMMHGVHLLAPHLAEQDWEALRKVFVSEADWLLRFYTRGGHNGVTGGLWAVSGLNDPESNLWNGAILWRATTLYPDHPHAADWTERAHEFFVNGISLPSDAGLHDVLLAGIPIAERHRGPNFFPHYALDHHGYLNVGYMVICLSNIAMLHFDQQAAGLPLPESLYLHAADLWKLVRRLVFSDGRLARIGGDTRLRYSYCQEYLLPTLVLADQVFGDPHAIGLLDRILDWVELEAVHNGDGSFFGDRFASMRAASPYYYTRLESDRANALGMACTYLEAAGRVDAEITPRSEAFRKAFEQSVAGGWCEPEHGAVFHRSPTRLASYAWRGFGLGIGLCLPPANGHLAEWQNNLTGRVRFVGDDGRFGGPPHREVAHQAIREFEGGFATLGTLLEGSNLSVPEGWRRTAHSARHEVAFVALPDAHTVVGLQFCRTADYRTYLCEIQGLALQLPNDLFNGGRRQLETATGPHTLFAPSPADEACPLHSTWACIDGQLGVAGLYGAESLTLLRTPRRQGGKYPSLFVETLCHGHLAAVTAFAPSSVVLDTAWVVIAGADAEATRRVAASAHRHAPEHEEDGLRTVVVPGQDGHTYIVAAHFGSRSTVLALPCPVRDVATDAAHPAGPLELASQSLHVFRRHDPRAERQSP